MDLGPENLKAAERIVEALIFAAPEPVTEERLREALPGGVELNDVLASLLDFYQDRGPRLEQGSDGRWRFNCMPTLEQLPPVTRKQPKGLTEMAKNVLSIIALHQPISLKDIEDLRQTRVSPAIMKTLIAEGWIMEGPRLQSPGSPVGWVTTNAFLERLGLPTLSDLPDPDEFERNAWVREEEDWEKTRLGISAMPIAGRGSE